MKILQLRTYTILFFFLFICLLSLSNAKAQSVLSTSQQEADQIDTRVCLGDNISAALKTIRSSSSDSQNREVLFCLLQAKKKFDTLSELTTEQQQQAKTIFSLTLQTRYKLKQYAQVIEEGKAFLSKGNMGKEASIAYFYVTLSLYETKQELLASYMDINSIFALLTVKQQRTLRTILINNDLKKHRPMNAFSYLEKEPGVLIKDAGAKVLDVIQAIDSLDDIRELLSTYQDSTIIDSLKLRYANLLLQSNKKEEGKEVLSQINVTALYGMEQRNYYRLRLYSLRDPSKEAKIGVLLPLSTPSLRNLVNQTLNGLEQAMQDLAKDGKKWTLVIRDTSLPKYRHRLSREAKKEKIARHMHSLVQQLVEGEGVLAIVGPLRRDFTKALATSAQEYHVPIISFSLTENIGKDSDFLFRFQSKQTLQAETMVNYAFDYLHAKRFVLFSPSDEQSMAVTKAFGKQVEARGGTIVGVAYINPKDRDFQNYFASFTGGYRRVGWQEKKELLYLRERVKPIVDFDAIFIPVSARTTYSLIAFRNLFNADNTWLLGTSKLNTKRTQTFKNHVKLRFIDTFPYSAIPVYLHDFYTDYWKKYSFSAEQSEPTSYTIYAYESLKILNRLYQDGATTPSELKEALLNLKNMPVLTGSASYIGNGEIMTSVHVLETKGQKILFVFPPNKKE